MSNGKFYSPEAVRPLYDEIVPAYQAAFAGEPWYEVSKCPDELRRCVGGLSAVAIGSLCGVCDGYPAKPAYEASELVERFEALAASRPTTWYVEEIEGGVPLAAIAWKADSETIADEKYQDVPVMQTWLAQTVGDKAIGWLDEVFANKSVRPQGNLQNFGPMCTGIMDRLETDMLAYRTINTRMVAVARRDFENRATIFERGSGVPDRREFIVIRSDS